MLTQLTYILPHDWWSEAFPPPPRKYKNVDLFAGKCAISRSFKAQGYATCSMDIEINELDVAWFTWGMSKQEQWQPWQLCCMLCLLLLDSSWHSTQDILSPVGFIRTLYAAIHIARGGLCTMGVVCSSFTQINRYLSNIDLEGQL